MKEGVSTERSMEAAWALKFHNRAAEVASIFAKKFNVVQSLGLTLEQTNVFLAYFAHYWILKTNIETARKARDPMLEQMLKIPVLGYFARTQFDRNNGVYLAGQLLNETAENHAAFLRDNSRGNMQRAANLLSSIYTGTKEGNEQNSQIDRAFSRIRIWIVTSK